MSKKFLHKAGAKFIWNGDSQIRVNEIERLKHKDYPQHVVKVFEVAQVVRDNFENPIKEGQIIGVAFPEDRINAKEYQWGSTEPFQVPIKFRDEAPKIVHGSI